MADFKFAPRDGTITMEAARVNAGLNLDEASKAIGISRFTLWNYEHGKTSPTVETVRKMCAVYDVEFSKLTFLTCETN